MIIIGLTGYKRAGKDTVADYLVDLHGFTKLSMAAPLKRMIRSLNPLLGGGTRLMDIWDDTETVQKNEEWIKGSIYADEYRRLLQLLGTDCVRTIDPDFWVRAMVKEIEESGADRVVISDVRFPNEGELIWNPQRFQLRKVSPSSLLLQVDRDGVEYDPAGHESEQWVGAMGEHAVIHNDGVMGGDLFDNVEDILSEFGVL